MITERGGTGSGGNSFVITEDEDSLRSSNEFGQLPCVPTGAGIFGGFSRMTTGGRVGGGGGR